MGRVEVDSRLPTADSPRPTHSRSAFTLIELMVSMSIFAVITGFVLVNYRGGQRSDELRQAGEVAASVMRDAIFRAVGGSLADVCLDTTGVKSMMPAGGSCPAGSLLVPQVPPAWGVAFGSQDPGHIIVFADLDASGFPTDGEVVSVTAYSQSGLVDADPSVPALVSMTIAVPSLETLVDGVRPIGEVELILIHGGSGERKAVRFAPMTGRIDVGNP